MRSQIRLGQVHQIMKKLLISSFAILIATVANSQNVGVDVTTPLEKLDVAGAIKIGTTSNTPTGGAGTIRWNGTEFQGWDGTQWITFGGGGGVSGSLDDAYDNGSTITTDNGPVIIAGTGGLDVAGNAIINQDATISGNLVLPTGANNNYIAVSDSFGNVTWTAPATISTQNDGDWTVSGNNQYSSVSGNVGINSTTPSHKLHVIGTDNSVFRLQGIGSYGSGARFNFGDQNFVYIEEDINDNIHYYAATRHWFDGGNVGIGTTTPTAKLDVVGSVKIADGNQAAGKVLTSDANGLATWQNASGSGPQVISASPTGDTLYLQDGGWVLIPGISLMNYPPPPVIGMGPVTVYDHTQASLSVTVQPGGAQVTEVGLVYSTSPNPTLDNGSTVIISAGLSFVEFMTGLTPNTTYYVRGYATNIGGTGYGTVDRVFTTHPDYGLNIGDTHQGGIIFYLNGTGGGLIAAPNDQSTGAIWGCSGAIPGANSNVLGGGAQNTIDIVAYCPTGGCCIPNAAAVICANLTLGGYSDWYLPNAVELSLMEDIIGPDNVLGLGNIGGFSGVYWSSRKGTNNGNAYSNQMPGTNTTSQRDLSFRVRAVRAF
jgi:hypothetical protein